MGTGHRAAFPDQALAWSHEADSEPDSAEKKSVFFVFLNFNHDLRQIFFLLSDVPTINRVFSSVQSLSRVRLFATP